MVGSPFCRHDGSEVGIVGAGNVRVADQNEAAGATAAALCHTQDVWVRRDRNIALHHKALTTEISVGCD